MPKPCQSNPRVFLEELSCSLMIKKGWRLGIPLEWWVPANHQEISLVGKSQEGITLNQRFFLFYGRQHPVLGWKDSLQGSLFVPGRMVIITRWGHDGDGARALLDHLREIAWAFLLIFLFLACLLVIFGRDLGFDSIIRVCLSLALIVLGPFGMITLSELLWIVIRTGLR